MGDNFYNKFHCSYLSFWHCTYNLSDISQVFTSIVYISVGVWYQHFADRSISLHIKFSEQLSDLVCK